MKRPSAIRRGSILAAVALAGAGSAAATPEQASAARASPVQRGLQQFDAWDGNGTKRLSGDEVARAGAAGLGTFDTNRDGLVSRLEFRRGVRRSGKIPDEGRPLRSKFYGTWTLAAGVESATVRLSPLGLVAGRVFPGEPFVVEFVSKKGWAWGYAGGDAQRPGWIALSKLRRESTSAPAGHISPGEPTDLAANVRYSRTKPFTRGVRVKADRPLRIFANYSPERGPLREILTLPPETEVGFRYSIDGRYGVVLEYGRPENQGIWGIVNLDDLELPESWRSPTRSRAE